MRNPVQFLLRFRYLFFFLALQAVAFAMLLRTQGHQQSVWMATTGDVVGSIQERRDNVRSYLHLREINEDLHGHQNPWPHEYGMFASGPIPPRAPTMLWTPRLARLRSW